MAPEKILVVDDDRNLLQILRMRLESSEFQVSTAMNGAEAMALASNQSYDVSIIDHLLDNEDGISLMEEMHRLYPDMPVIILTAHGSIEKAVEAMQKGAYNYLTKPYDERNLILQINRALERGQLSQEVKRLKEMVADRYAFGNIIARSESMRRVLEQVSRIAKTDSSVFISGESGTGKELVARAIHLMSDRQDHPFVAINCAAIPESLMESELFGYEKGAFTGAVKRSKGLFNQADMGTIFLDEIGDMPLSTQAKFLRVLQDRQFQPLGGEKPVKVDIRVIVATNKDLRDEVKNGRFREDLFYRIHVIPLVMPTLRERKEDIPPLVDFFLKKHNKEMGKSIKGMTPAAMKKLMLHNWPGNVRELNNVVEYAVVMTQEKFISEDYILLENDKPLRVPTMKEAKINFERDYLLNLIKITHGNVCRASEISGRYRADLYQLFKKHGISPGDYKYDETAKS